MKAWKMGAIALLNSIVWYYIWRHLEMPYDLVVPVLAGLTLAIVLLAFDRNISFKESISAGVLSLMILTSFHHEIEIFNKNIVFILTATLLLALPGVIALVLIQLLFLVAVGKANKAQKAGVIGGLLNLLIWTLVITLRSTSEIPSFPLGLPRFLSILLAVALPSIPVGIMLIIWGGSLKDGAIGGSIAGLLPSFSLLYYSVFSSLGDILVKFKDPLLDIEVGHSIGPDAYFILIGIVYVTLHTLIGTLAILAISKSIRSVSKKGKGGGR